MMDVASGRLRFVHRKLGRRYTGAQDSFRRQLHAVERQAAERGPQIVERQTRVEQRAKRHVAGDSGEAVEIEETAHRAACS